MTVLFLSASKSQNEDGKDLALNTNTIETKKLHHFLFVTDSMPPTLKAILMMNGAVS
jgi:hypothetical protein